jgi:hypothetical protein
VQPWKLSIVLEWENVHHSDPDRARRLLERLAEEVRADDGQLAGPVELLVGADAPDVEDCRAFVGAALAGKDGLFSTRVLAVPGAEYYELKNAGAAAATGDIVLYLDSDVVPDPGYLASLLRPFDDDEVAGVAGNSYIETTTVFEKAFALTWNFPLRSTTDEQRPAERFASNNVAFRREVAQRFPFPTITETARGSCSWLGVILARKGLKVVEAPSAQVVHPAPSGARNFTARALARGRDRVMLVGPGPPRTARATALRFRGDLGRSARALMRNRRHVGLRPGQVPLAFGVALLFALCSALGELATLVQPRFMIRHFRV